MTYRTKPDWFHQHGNKMTVENVDMEKKRLKISSPAANVQITRIELGWLVSWEIRHSQNEFAKGAIIFNSKDLRHAFTFTIFGNTEFDMHLMRAFNADAAVQGKFIKKSHFLNIPCPGTGHDLDPNISIMIDENMQEAVQKLLKGFDD